MYIPGLSDFFQSFFTKSEDYEKIQKEKEEKELEDLKSKDDENNGGIAQLEEQSADNR